MRVSSERFELIRRRPLPRCSITTWARYVRRPHSARPLPLPRSRLARIDLPPESGIQDVFRHLANDRARTAAIAAEIRKAFDQGRKVLVLTERTEHLDAIQPAYRFTDIRIEGEPSRTSVRVHPPTPATAALPRQMPGVVG